MVHLATLTGADQVSAAKFVAENANVESKRLIVVQLQSDKYWGRLEADTSRTLAPIAPFGGLPAENGSTPARREISFRKGAYAIDDLAKANIDELAALAISTKGNTILVSSNTDVQRTDAAYMELTFKRVEAVESYLRSSWNIPQEHLERALLGSVVYSEKLDLEPPIYVTGAMKTFCAARSPTIW